MASSNENSGTRGGTPEQQAEAGRQRQKNEGSNDGSANASNTNSDNTRGGTPEQHAEAGRQSHKNDDQGASGSGSNSGRSAARKAEATPAMAVRVRPAARGAARRSNTRRQAAKATKMTTGVAQVSHVSDGSGAGRACILKMETSRRLGADT